jgi:16S rRNA (cytidine1402-2'-O)-methyltransferase
LTGRLVNHLGLKKRLIRYDDHADEKDWEYLLSLMAQEPVALVSDAGTPLVSDPGYRLVRAAREAGVRVSPVPGPSALVAALSVAGLPSDRFAFEGFLPARASARRERLAALAGEPRTLIFYESSHRIEEMLADAAGAFGGERRAVMARELTKLFGTVLDGPLDELRQRVADDANQRKGEFVVMVEAAGEDEGAKIAEGRRVYALLKAQLPPSAAARLAAEITGAPRKALYGAPDVD